MLSEICFSLDQSKILLSGNGLKASANNKLKHAKRKAFSLFPTVLYNSVPHGPMF